MLLIWFLVAHKWILRVVINNSKVTLLLRNIHFHTVVCPKLALADLFLMPMLPLHMVEVRVQLALPHETCSAVQRPSANVLRSLREEFAKLQQLVLGDTHKHDIALKLFTAHPIDRNLNQVFERLFANQSFLFFVPLRQLSERLVNEVGLEAVQDLPVAEVAILRQVEDRLPDIHLVFAVFEQLDKALADEVHLVHVLFIRNELLARVIDTRIQADNHFVEIAALTLTEEVAEVFFEFAELPCCLNDLSLHIWRDLVKELELLNQHVEIVQQRLLDVRLDVGVESGLNELA